MAPFCIFLLVLICVVLALIFYLCRKQFQEYLENKIIKYRLKDIFVDTKILSKRNTINNWIRDETIRDKLGEILVDMGAVSESDLDIVLEQKKDMKLGRFLVDNNIINLSTFFEAMKKQKELRFLRS